MPNYSRSMTFLAMQFKFEITTTFKHLDISNCSIENALKQNNAGEFGLVYTIKASGNTNIWHLKENVISTESQ